MDKLIKKVLVANRGEIAIRIFKTLHELGISSLAVFSEADKNSSHVSCANNSCLLVGESLQDTYLNIDQIIQTAIEHGVDAIHPGYGFLSESADFSRAVRQAGIIFIGPGDEAIHLMGNKVEARKFVEQLKVPVVKGATGQPEELIGLAGSIGYPLLVKAAAGGGGKGMRIVNNASELPEVLETTQREAKSYFGQGEVYIEQYLVNPKHIEVQLIADSFGNIACLFERECSIQRRYQKIIEEAPSPSVSPELRNRLMEAARHIAAGIAYVNAGTIEFLVQQDDFYFLEMNTRIQVEHPVTEMITGIDLVREQLSISTGLPLSFRQEELVINGHAIEARVYAEDPENGFLPSPGQILLYKEPSMKGVRIDTSLNGPGEISRQFDPMISKVIAHGGNRNEARSILIEALKEYAVHGIKTNIHYMISLLESEKFVSGQTDTGFCKQFPYNPSEGLQADKDMMNLLAAACLFLKNNNTFYMTEGNSHKHNPQLRNYCKSPLWCETGYWRLFMAPAFIVNGKNIKVEISERYNNLLTFRDGERLSRIKLMAVGNNTMELNINHHHVKMFFSHLNEGFVSVQHLGRVYSIGMALQLNEDEVNNKSHNTSVAENGHVYAPMHGKIIKVLVKEEQTVNKGDTLLILESMKIENKILSPGRARVERISVSAGDVVVSNAQLVLLAADN